MSFFAKKITGRLQKMFSLCLLMKYATYFHISSYGDQDSGNGSQICAHKMDGLLVFTTEFICNDGECQKKIHMYATQQAVLIIWMQSK